MNKIASFISVNKSKFVVIAIIFIIVVLVYLIYNNEPKPKDDAINNPIVEQVLKEQAERIEQLEFQILEFNKNLRKKEIKDSILFVKGQKDISELKLSIKKSSDEAKQKHILNSNSDIEQSYNTLSNNIKKRSKK
jgi:hypothetical protein